MKRNSAILLLVLFLIGAIIGIFFSYIFLTNTSLQEVLQKTFSKDKTAQDAPELKDILDTTDQKKQFNAARKLAERVGVEEALDILYASSLPKTGEGHLVVHQIGFYAYKKYDIDAVAHCKDYFLYACYHGAIIEAASDKGFDVIPKMTDRCKSSTNQYFQCVHAAGHALVAMWGYDLPKALEMCDEFYEKETALPGVVTSCHNGAFMENIFGVHDWGSGKPPVRDWLSDTDPYFPCNHFAQKYQEGCWMNQASRIFQMNKGDLAKTTKDCDGIGNDKYTEWCINSLARQINALTYGNPSAPFELCKQMGRYWYNTCVLVNAGAFYSLAGREQAIAVCMQANSSSTLKKDCYNGVIALVSRDSLTHDQKEQLCKKIESAYTNQCHKAINAPPQ
jgi:hypothetical protein